jgi:hypothetical protein
MQKKVMLLAVFLLSFLAAVAPAQSQFVDPQCIDQLKSQCGEIEPGSGRIQKCFDDNRDKFSPVCQQQLMEGKAEAAAGMVQSGQGKELGKADPITLTNDAIVDLTDAPGLGKRTTVDLNKRWGSDVGVIASATAKLQSALNKASDSSARAQHLLKLAVEYGKWFEHKEERLAAQGALLNLCQAANKTDTPCDKVPKYGSYVAP